MTSSGVEAFAVIEHPREPALCGALAAIKDVRE
jgi:hypothetical protein